MANKLPQITDANERKAARRRRGVRAFLDYFEKPFGQQKPKQKGEVLKARNTTGGTAGA